MKTVFRPHAYDSKPESVLSHFMSCIARDQTGFVGDKCLQKVKGLLCVCVRVLSEEVVSKASRLRASGQDRPSEITRLFFTLS